ncbi:hypothetical protein CCMA1212_004527 [Trichoderma ghanense]|uniref:Uncharacterized protein n=1 Tax=Trichoderma ghanense TaxID=65468 RepID=A0ABY2H4I5_9HYPO
MASTRILLDQEDATLLHLASLLAASTINVASVAPAESCVFILSVYFTAHTLCSLGDFYTRRIGNSETYCI